MPKIKRTRRSKSKTGYFGVRKRPSGKYEATLQMGKCETNQMKRRTISLGYYDTAKEAAKRYDIEAIKSHRPFSALNYPKKAPVGYTPIQKALQSRNTVGYRGVSKSGKKFVAQIRINGKNVNLDVCSELLTQCFDDTSVSDGVVGLKCFLYWCITNRCSLRIIQ